MYVHNVLVVPEVLTIVGRSTRLQDIRIMRRLSLFESFKPNPQSPSVFVHQVVIITNFVPVPQSLSQCRFNSPPSARKCPS